MAIVVFAPLSSDNPLLSNPPLNKDWSRCGLMPRSPNSLSISNGAAWKHPRSPVTTEPRALTTTRAPTVTPSANTRDADPSPPFKFAVVAPVPAPAVPVANSAVALLNALRPRSGYGFAGQFLSPPFRRSKMIALETSGTRTSATSNPRPAR